MKRILHILSLFLLLQMLPIAAGAQLPSDSTALQRVEEGDSVKERPFKRFLRRTKALVLQTVKNLDKSDSVYIEPNHYDWTIMLQNSNFFQLLGFTASHPEFGDQTLSFSPRAKCKIGPYIGWKWIFLGYGFDVGRPKSAGKITEFSLSIYTNKIGGDVIYLKNTSNFHFRRTEGFPDVGKRQFGSTDFSGLSSYMLSVNAYYVFNNKKFSYPAAYNQSTQQKRSAGSFLLGFRYDHQRFNFDYTQLPTELQYDASGNEILADDLKFKRLTYSSYCINGGYAYNFVFARNWLLAASLTPSIGIKLLKGEHLTGKTFLKGLRTINFDLVGRAGIVWNNSRCFAGASFVTHFYEYKRSGFSVTNSINYLNIYAGINFYPQKQYRKEP